MPPFLREKGMKHSSNPKVAGAKKRKAAPKFRDEIAASEASVFPTSARKLSEPGPGLALNPSADRLSADRLSAESLGVPYCQSSPWFDFWCKIFDVAQEFDLNLGDDADAKRVKAEG